MTRLGYDTIYLVGYMLVLRLILAYNIYFNMI